jgi:hypothetical protein
LRVDCVLLAQFPRFLAGRRKRVQVRSKVSSAREEINNLSLNCRIEQIQSVRIGFVDREFRQYESTELVKMFFGADLAVLKLPNFFKALHAFYDGRNFSDESRRKASSRTAAPKQKHDFLPLRLSGELIARGVRIHAYLNSKTAAEAIRIVAVAGVALKAGRRSTGRRTGKSSLHMHHNG